jgi:apolipoprotein N-acyltransferase
MGHTATAEETRQAAEAYFRLSGALPAGCDLIVWPETAIPTFIELNAEYRGRLAAMAREKGSYLLVGGAEPAPEGKVYNTLFLFTPQGEIADKYRKVHLVLFGEYVPWRKQLKFLKRFPIRPFDYAPGRGFALMQAGDMKFGNLICFESLFARYTRYLCRLGAEFLVITTSDHWAQGTYELAQHSRIEVLRAVEARRFVVRVATDGESMIITPFGQRLSVLEIGEQGAQHDLVFRQTGLSLYHRWGDLPLLLGCMILWLAALGAAQPLSRRNSRG